MGTFRYQPTPRVEYTIGVSGCDKRSTYVVVCAEGGGCVQREPDQANTVSPESASPRPDSECVTVGPRSNSPGGL